jgi:hypothetical protein
MVRWISRLPVHPGWNSGGRKAVFDQFPSKDAATRFAGCGAPQKADLRTLVGKAGLHPCPRFYFTAIWAIR